VLLFPECGVLRPLHFDKSQAPSPRRAVCASPFIVFFLLPFSCYIFYCPCTNPRICSSCGPSFPFIIWRFTPFPFPFPDFACPSRFFCKTSGEGGRETPPRIPRGGPCSTPFPWPRGMNPIGSRRERFFLVHWMFSRTWYPSPLPSGLRSFCPLPFGMRFLPFFFFFPPLCCVFRWRYSPDRFQGFSLFPELPQV